MKPQLQLQIVRGAGKTAEIIAAWNWNWLVEDIGNEDFPNLPSGCRVRWAHE